MHIALFCPPYPSHVHVFQLIAETLITRGHRATLVLNQGAEQFVSSGVPVITINSGRVPSALAAVRRAANPGGPFGILRTVSDAAALTDALCTNAPGRLREIGVDAILGDQMEPAAGLIARHLQLPFLSIACALPLERDERIPPPYLGWPYATDERGIKNNRGGEKISHLMLTAQRRTIAQWAKTFGLAGLETIEDCLAPAGTVAQTVPAIDFPRTPSARPLIGVGPIRREMDDAEFPFPIDPARPFAFMSLGTLQGHRFGLFRTVAKACKKLDIQLLVAHCGGLTDDQAASLGATWVTDFAPQRAVLAGADLCITHCGQNTVMDALEFGVPLLGIPIAFDQPGIAARIVHHGVGLRVSQHYLRVSTVEAALRTLLGNPTYRERAREVGTSIATAGGLAGAIDAIETLITRQLS